MGGRDYAEECGNFIYLLAVDVQASSVRGLLATGPITLDTNLDPQRAGIELTRDSDACDSDDNPIYSCS